MSQVHSEYARLDFDQYETPDWVTEALLPHIPGRIHKIWEPACGSGKMVRALRSVGYKVEATDLQKNEYEGQPALDFLECGWIREAIVTNPPYSHATDFIYHALAGVAPYDGFVAMLLRCDFDSASSRADLFTCKQFAKKLVLTKRIRWIEGSKGSPSFNHAWFMWDWQHQGPATLAYGQ